MAQHLLSTSRRRFLGGLAALAAGGATAQVAPSPSLPALSSELIRTGLYQISGGGGHSLLRFSANGLILVGSKLPGQQGPLMAQVRRISKISDLPVRVVLATDHQPMHVGNHARLAARGAVRIGQADLVRQIAADLPAAATDRPVPPWISFEREHTLKLGGVEVGLLNVGGGRTRGDTVVHFADLRVVAVGELYTSGRPEPDTEAGGSLAGWREALDRVLTLDFDIVVPATGPRVGRAELQALAGRLDDLLAR